MAGPDMRPPVPTAHSLVKFLHKQCVAQMISRNELARRAGISDTTLQNWWDARGALIIQNVEAALGVLGYGIRQELLPARLSQADLAVGESYRLRCGEFATIEGGNANRFWGKTLKGGIPLEWNLAGQRVPAGGESPMDIVLGAAAPKEKAA